MSRNLHSSMKALLPAAVRKIFSKGITQLLDACDDGDLKAVRRLVEFWGVDVKATATFHFLFIRPDWKVLDASPLFVAAFRGHYEIVRYLVGKGADIFAKTSDHNDSCFAGLTPLYGCIASLDWAFSARQLDATLRFLLESAGTNLSALLTTTSGPIWRMYCCGPYSTIPTIRKYDMNLLCSRTILHHWASKSLCYNHGSHEGSLLELVQLLVEKGVDLVSPDFNGHTPLFLSAAPETNHICGLNFSVFDFLLEREEIGRLDKINALELAGAVILSFSSDATQIPRAFAYWRRAHHLRYLVGVDPIPKTPIIFKITQQRVEWTTLPQLEEIENDPSQHKIASLLVHLRMLSVSDKWIYGYSYLGNSPVGLVLYPYERRLRQGFTEAVDSIFIVLDFMLRYDSKECQIWSETARIVKKLVALLKEHPHRCTSEIFKTSVKLITAAIRNQIASQPLSYLKTLLQFVSVLADHPEMLNKDIMDSLTQLVKQDGRKKGRFNLLLLACSEVSSGTDLTATINLLLKAKADPNLVNPHNGRASLHVLASVIHDQQEMEDSIAHQLLNAGAHLDMVDREGRTAADIWLIVRNRKEKQLWSRKNCRVWDRHDLPDWCQEDVPKLVCLCARAAQRHKVPKMDKLPITLSAFVRMH